MKMRKLTTIMTPLLLLLFSLASGNRINIPGIGNIDTIRPRSAVNHGIVFPDDDILTNEDDDTALLPIENFDQVSCMHYKINFTYGFYKKSCQ